MSLSFRAHYLQLNVVTLRPGVFDLAQVGARSASYRGTHG
jgi:hypothetical protein